MGHRTVPCICLALVVLASACCWPQSSRPRKKMIRALTAIDVSAGVDQVKYRASLPWAIAQVLVYSGVKTDYAEFCAVSGWSAEFHYEFDKQWVSYLSLTGLASGRCFSRGIQNYGKRLVTFAWPKAEDENQRLLAARAAWDFTLSNIAGDRPVLTDYLDGGVLWGYDETVDDPVVHFSTNGPGAGTISRSAFYELFQRQLHGLGVIADEGDAPAPQAIMLGVLANLLLKAYEPESDGAPAGVEGMQRLASDLMSTDRDWGADHDWLCWPLANQTETRLCTAVFLRRNADLLGEKVRPHLLAAADHYEAAFNAWRQRWNSSFLTAGIEDKRPPAQRLSDPGRREAIAGWVYEALGRELLALGEVHQAIAAAQAADLAGGGAS